MCQRSLLSTAMAMTGFKRPRTEDYSPSPEDYSPSPEDYTPKYYSAVQEHHELLEGLGLQPMGASQMPVRAKRSRNHSPLAPPHYQTLEIPEPVCESVPLSLGVCEDEPAAEPHSQIQPTTKTACVRLWQLPMDCPAWAVQGKEDEAGRCLTSSSDDRAIARMCLQDLLMRHSELQPDLASWPAMDGAVGEASAAWLGGRCREVIEDREGMEDGVEGVDDDECGMEGSDDDEEEKENKLIAALCLQDLLGSSQAALAHETEAAMSHVSTGNCPGRQLSECDKNELEGAHGAAARNDMAEDVDESFGGLFEDSSGDWDRAIAQMCLKDLQASLGEQSERFSNATSCFGRGAGSSSCIQGDENVEAVVGDNM